MQGKWVRGGAVGIADSAGLLLRRLFLATAIVVTGMGAAIAAPVIQFSKTPDSLTVYPGQEMRFTFTITNVGDQDADFPQLTDALPGAGLFRWRTDVSKDQNSSCFFDINQGAQTLFCDFDTLAPGATVKAFITATPTTCPFVLSNTATVESVNAQPSLVTDSGEITVACEPASRCDISIDKTCSIETQSLAKPPKFHCPDPFDGFSVEWDPGATNDAFHTVIADPNQVVDVRIWNGPIGSAAPVDIGGGALAGPVVYCNVQPGDVVRVGGLNSGKKKPADDQSWEIFEHDPACINGTTFAPTRQRLGISKFRINCKDSGMKEAVDCGMLLGDGKLPKNKVTNLVNDWRLAGIAGDKKGDADVLQCGASSPTAGEQQNCEIATAGDMVTYQYTVTNKGAAPVVVNVTDDRKPGGTIASNVPIPAASPGNSTGHVRKYTWGPVPINTTTINTATATGNRGATDECVATDRVIVTTPCFLGNPATGKLYPYVDPAHPRTAIVFNENEVLQRLEPAIATAGQTLRMWYADEHAMLLGIRSATIRTKTQSTTQTATVTPFTAQYPANGQKLAGEATNPMTGLTEYQGGVDPAGRPIPPSLFCTDVTDNALSNIGDWQMGGTAQGPHFISGTWKSATVMIDMSVTTVTRVVTTDADPPKNGFVLGPNADPVPAGISTQGYLTEARWNVDQITCNGTPLKKGHTYRMQFMVHDGDQNKTGGDVGQACATVSIPQ